MGCLTDEPYRAVDKQIQTTPNRVHGPEKALRGIETEILQLNSVLATSGHAVS